MFQSEHIGGESAAEAMRREKVIEVLCWTTEHHDRSDIAFGSATLRIGRSEGFDGADER